MGKRRKKKELDCEYSDPEPDQWVVEDKAMELLFKTGKKRPIKDPKIPISKETKQRLSDLNKERIRKYRLKYERNLEKEQQRMQEIKTKAEQTGTSHAALWKMRDSNQTLQNEIDMMKAQQKKTTGKEITPSQWRKHCKASTILVIELMTGSNKLKPTQIDWYNRQGKQTTYSLNMMTNQKHRQAIEIIDRTIKRQMKTKIQK